MSQTISTPSPASTDAKIINIHVRSQKSVGAGGPGQFGGPDRYVAVTIAPAGAQVPKVLRRDVLAARGIEIRYCGEGYSRHDGPRSMLGQAWARAHQIVAEAW